MCRRDNFIILRRAVIIQGWMILIPRRTMQLYEMQRTLKTDPIAVRG